MYVKIIRRDNVLISEYYITNKIYIYCVYGIVNVLFYIQIKFLCTHIIKIIEFDILILNANPYLNAILQCVYRQTKLALVKINIITNIFDFSILEFK